MGPALVSPDELGRPGGDTGTGGSDDRRFMRWVLWLALGAKLVALSARYYIIYVVYDGVSDVPRYVENGTRIAAELRAGGVPEEATRTGTEFLDFVVGVIFTVTGPRTVAAFVVLTLLAYLGLVLFHRAFVLAVPDGDHRRYALLVFFLPTMLFWTSSIGKEAWITFGFGLAAYGAARVYRRRRYGYVALGLGLAAVFMIRPHMAALFAASFAAGFLLRPASDDRAGGWVTWFAGLALAAVAAVGLVGTIDDQLPVDPSSGGNVLEQVTAVTEDRTSKGGSEFENRPVRGPVDFAHALVTVPFRPFPWEVSNAQARLAGLEGLILLGLVVHSRDRLRRLPRLALRRPLVAMAGVYTAAFVIAFSAIGNFGILARQRAQLLPFLAIMLCLPPALSERPALGAGPHVDDAA